ncbi:MAG: hypothetical protein KGM47_04885 [Acidobacteriota bacterium]|nr:hypothetical protein [Acidobacteriota bacterium]
MASPLTNLKLSLRLDHETYSDSDTRRAMLEAFPPGIRPDASVTHFLSEQSIQYIVLVVIVGVSWGLKKVLGPPLDELGNYLRDSVRVCMKRRNRVPPRSGITSFGWIRRFESALTPDH